MPAGKNVKREHTRVKSIKKAEPVLKRSSEGFLKFLFERRQKTDFFIFIPVYLLIYFIISNLYPYPDVFPDTGNYLLSAKTMTVGGYRPIGYSWFLNFFHSISESIHFLFFAQYILHVISTLLFIFTIKYFFRPAVGFLYYIFSIVIIVSPGAIYLTNYIMSDTVFASLTLLFLASLLWINLTNNNVQRLFILAFHLIVLYFVFNVRYVALFYPLISIIGIILTYKNKFVAVLISLMPLIVVFGIYNKTRNEMKKNTGVDTFSAFGGWAMANNAVSVIPYIDLKADEIADPYQRYIHSVMVQFDDSVYAREHIMETDFMWRNDFPGKQIFFRIRQQANMNYVTGWVFAGELYNEYGIFLIKKFPAEFFKYFILENAKNIFKYYNIPNPEVYKPDNLHKEWFNLNIDEHKFTSTLFADLNPIVKIVQYIKWFLFFCAIALMFIFYRSFNFTSLQRNIVILLLTFIFLYLIFSVVSHPINNFRYLIPVNASIALFIYIIANIFAGRYMVKATEVKN